MKVGSAWCGGGCRLSEDRVLSALTVAGTDGPAITGAGEVTRPDLGSEGLHSLILRSLEEDVASDIVSISLAGKSSEADMMVIASGRSSRHVAAISEKLMDRLKQDAGVIPRVEGKASADWTLIDAGDVIVHVFRPEVREFYQLEKMWEPSPDVAARSASN